MHIRWVTAFLDAPTALFERRIDFWARITMSTLSARRGTTGEFGTLIPPDGDAYLRSQRIAEGPGGTHLDLHTNDVRSAVNDAATLGATVVADHGYVVLASPGGFVFCIVSWHGEKTQPKPCGNPASRVDQVSLDIAFDLFESECRFWSALTGWELRRDDRDERGLLARPEGMPLRLLLQRGDASGDRPNVQAHLEIACGMHGDDLVRQHVANGALVSGSGPTWTTLADPTGLRYCLTSRSPG